MAKDTKKGASEPAESYAPHVLEKFIRPGIKWGIVILVGLFVIYKIRTYDDRTGDPRYSLRKQPPASQEITLTEYWSTTEVVCTEEWINTIRPNFHWPYTVHWVNYRINQQADTPMEAGQLFDCRKDETMILRFKIEAGYKGPPPTVTVLHAAPSP